MPVVRLAVGLWALAWLSACGPRAVPVAPPLPPGRVVGEVVSEGALATRLRDDGADLVLLYGAEHRGAIGPCGCPKERRGGLPRLEGWADAVRAGGSPALVLHAGAFLEDAVGVGGGLRPDVPLVNRWMARALRAGSWTAINVGSADLPGLADLGPEGAGLPLVSANVRGPEGAVVRWLVREAAPGVLVGVTGVATPGPTLAPAPGWSVVEPGPALAEALDALDRAGASIVVLLASDAVPAAREAALAHPGIDVVIDAAHHVDASEAFPMGGAVWVRVPHQSRRVGELRLWIEDGRVVRAVDRKVDLDPDVPADPALEALEAEARVEIDRREREIWGP